MRELLREFVETAQALTDSTFPEAMDELNGFLAPLIAGARHDSPPPGSWIPGKGWVESLDLAADGEWGVHKSGR